MPYYQNWRTPIRQAHAGWRFTTRGDRDEASGRTPDDPNLTHSSVRRGRTEERRGQNLSELSAKLEGDAGMAMPAMLRRYAGCAGATFHIEGLGKDGPARAGRPRTFLTYLDGGQHEQSKSILSCIFGALHGRSHSGPCCGRATQAIAGIPKPAPHAADVPAGPDPARLPPLTPHAAPGHADARGSRCGSDALRLFAACAEVTK